MENLASTFGANPRNYYTNISNQTVSSIIDVGTSPSSVVKIVLRPTMIPEAIEDLHRMNVSEASLFPGLEGFARSLGIVFRRAAELP
jgi:hypothetical protein